MPRTYMESFGAQIQALQMTSTKTHEGWFYQIMGESVGPIHASRLRELAETGTVRIDTLVRRGQDGDWVTASRVRGLFDERDDNGGQLLEDEKHTPPAPQRPLRFLLSTGDIPYPYELVDLVFAAGSSSEGIFKDVEPMQAYQLASQILMDFAADMGATAVVNIRYELRSAVGQGFGPYKVFEVYAYGTAVRCTDDSQWPRI